MKPLQAPSRIHYARSTLLVQMPAGQRRFLACKSIVTIRVLWQEEKQ